PGTTPPVPGRPTIFLPLLRPALWALLFAALTWQVAASGPLLGPDERLGDALRATSAIPSGPAEFFADLGNLPVALPVLAAALAFATWRARSWRPAAIAVPAMALVPALVAPLQSLIARPGPPPMAPGTGFYPSGHAATAAVAYGLCALLLRPHLSARPRRALLAACAALNLAVGLGLVRQGYHWPLDVLGSWLLSLALLDVCAWAWTRVRVRTQAGHL
ncbi:phosphatase PAP2 family protein, partial [Streptomyces sp. NPDC059524]|uniref:phosphatase PAP2 family protein n=1 Tax=Streptomyces sp. NPDC059524 TaxID=3346856 RepID=UPI0036B94D31